MMVVDECLNRAIAAETEVTGAGDGWRMFRRCGRPRVMAFREREILQSILDEMTQFVDLQAIVGQGGRTTNERSCCITHEL
jgi:hypothetical protein